MSGKARHFGFIDKARLLEELPGFYPKVSGEGDLWRSLGRDLKRLLLAMATCSEQTADRLSTRGPIPRGLLPTRDQVEHIFQSFGDDRYSEESVARAARRLLGSGMEVSLSDADLELLETKYREFGGYIRRTFFRDGADFDGLLACELLGLSPDDSGDTLAADAAGDTR